MHILGDLKKFFNILKHVIDDVIIDKRIISKNVINRILSCILKSIILKPFILINIVRPTNAIRNIISIINVGIQQILRNLCDVFFVCDLLQNLIVKHIEINVVKVDIDVYGHLLKQLSLFDLLYG